MASRGGGVKPFFEPENTNFIEFVALKLKKFFQVPSLCGWLRPSGMCACAVLGVFFEASVTMWLPPLRGGIRDVVAVHPW